MTAGESASTLLRPATEDEMIRRRMFDIVLSIRPLPPTARPPEAFIHETRNVLLTPVRHISLDMHRRERLLARLEGFTKTNRVV